MPRKKKQTDVATKANATNNFKERLRKLKQARSERAVALYLPSIDAEIKVAPATADDYYTSFLELRDFLAAQAVQAPTAEDEGERQETQSSLVTRSSMREHLSVLLKACIVEPEPDDEIIELLFHLPVGEFEMLVNACFAASVGSAIEAAQRIGVVQTGGMEDFLSSTAGSSSESTQP